MHEDEAQPYFANNTFQKSQNVYLKIRQRIQNRLEQQPTSSKGVQFDFKLETLLPKFDNSDSDSDNDQEPNISAHFGKIDDACKIPVGTIESYGLKLQLNDLQDIFDLSRSLSTEQNPSSGVISARIEILKSAWADFRRSYYEERAKENVQIQFIDFKKAQESYTLAYGKLNDLKSNNSSQNENIQLPKLKIPEFSGKVSEWPGFITLFDKIVHENSSISDGLKVQYLKTSLKSEAYKIIAHISPTAENYQNCYLLLLNRYDNKRALLSRVIDTIFLLPKHKNENSEDLKTLHDTVNECIMAIKNAGIQTKNWDILLVHILLHKLSAETIKNYECQLQDVKEPKSFLSS